MLPILDVRTYYTTLATSEAAINLDIFQIQSSTPK